MGVKWSGTLTTGLNQFGPHMKRSMVAAANYVAPVGEQFMKTNAPWTDRTGAARSGLHTKVVVSSNKVAIVFYHSVPYGVFLETRWGGKYAIVEPAIAYIGPLFAEVLAKMAFDEGTVA